MAHQFEGILLKDEISQQLRDAAQRLSRRGLFGRVDDCLSMRVPGTDALLWLTDAGAEPQTTSFNDTGSECGIHAAIYTLRSDAGAILLSTTRWSTQLAAIGKSPPTLFDEQARHLGKIAPPVQAGEQTGLLRAVAGGSNIAVYGEQCLHIGTTRDRVVFNAELFEKCAMAFVIASASGQRIKTIPGWVRSIAGGRLRKDQKKATVSYTNGQIPQGMNAY